jgi:hypothetical protein
MESTPPQRDFLGAGERRRETGQQSLPAQSIRPSDRCQFVWCPSGMDSRLAVRVIPDRRGGLSTSIVEIFLRVCSGGGV